MTSTGEESEDSWGQLMALAQQGDEQAYSTLLTQLYPVAQRYLIKKLGVFGADDDMIQDCFIALHKARASYQPGRPFKPWFFTVIRYRAIDAIRARQRRWEKEVQDEEYIVTKASEPTNTDQEELSERLMKALDELPDGMREAVRLTKVEGLSTQKAAEILGTTSVALRAKVSRAYKIMRKSLEKNYA